MIIGIDPGAHGAIAVMNADGQIVYILDMPTDPVAIGKETINRVSAHRLFDLLKAVPHSHVFIEWPEFRPILSFNKATGKQQTSNPSARRMGAMGINCATAYTVCVCLGHVITEVSPGGWKRAMGIPADKSEALRIARQLFPSHGDYLKRQLDNDRAEAMLIALYGKRYLGGLK
jgi:crossover junction endodeoxyribonuclease RuvC